MAVSPDGRSLYVTNQSADSVSQYTIDAKGRLTAKDPATIATDFGPLGLAVVKRDAAD